MIDEIYYTRFDRESIEELIKEYVGTLLLSEAADDYDLPKRIELCDRLLELCGNVIEASKRFGKSQTRCKD